MTTRLQIILPCDETFTLAEIFIYDRHPQARKIWNFEALYYPYEDINISNNVGQRQQWRSQDF